MRDERGAVTLFIIIIVVPIFLFHAVLIEFARSLLAKQQLELAVKAANRSVGAAFSAPLQTYGLYGLPFSNETKELYERIVRLNSGHGYAAALYENGEIQMERSLDDPEVFSNQVMEEMKYRAPLEYARQVTSKLKQSGLSAALQDFSSFGDKAQELDRLARNRDEQMRRVWRLYLDWDRWINDSLAPLAAQIRALEPEHSELRKWNPSEMRRSLAEMDAELTQLGQAENRTEELERYIERLAQARSELAARIARYERWLAELSSLRDRHRRIADQVNLIKDDLLAALEEAKSWNDKLRTSISEWQRDLGSEWIHSVVLIPDGDFTFVRGKAVQYDRELRALANETASLSARNAETLASELDSYIGSWSEWIEQVRAAKLEQEQREKQESEQREEAEREFGNWLEKLKQLFAGCDPEEEEQEQKLYAQLKERTDAADHDDKGDYADGRNARDDAVGLGQMIGQLAERLTETVYVNEYALVMFNYRTMGGNENSASGDRQQQTYTLSKPSEHPLRNQEVEYILYGYHSCQANYSAAYWEIFAVRLAIRTLELLMSPGKAGPPWIVFLIALAEGAAKAYQDTVKLKDGEELALSSKFAPSLTWNYKDYLRLFLLLHRNKDDYVKRMQALIELNTGLRLANHYTYWTSQANGSLRSLFLGRYQYKTKVEAAWGYY